MATRRSCSAALKQRGPLHSWTMSALFGLPLRQTTGLVPGLLDLTGPGCAATGFSTLSRRQGTPTVHPRRFPSRMLKETGTARSGRAGSPHGPGDDHGTVHHPHHGHHLWGQFGLRQVGKAPRERVEGCLQARKSCSKILPQDSPKAIRGSAKDRSDPLPLILLARGSGSGQSTSSRPGKR